MKIVHFMTSLLCAAIFLVSCANNQSGEGGQEQKTDTAAIKGETLFYNAGGSTFNGYLAYDENRQGKRPVVLIVHEWWGLNEYIRNRAHQLAGMGYLAMAVDMYGKGETVSDPQMAQQLATPFYQNPQLAKARIDAAFNQVVQHPQADTTKIAAIGYCFGGAMVLNYARMGAPIDGVVSFHGNLVGVLPQKDSLKAKILVCHGAEDPFVPELEVATFKKQMDSVDADYEFKAYANATHAFTNPRATEVGKQFNIPISYNGAADSASWNDMKMFFDLIFK